MLDHPQAAKARDRAKRRSVRSCVTCRRRAEARDLLRVVRAPDGGLVIDWRRQLGGRGAHVCPSRSCIETAIERHKFDRTLKSQPRYPRAQELLATAETALNRQLHTLLGSAKRSGKLAAGSDAVRRALNTGMVTGLLLAADASSREQFATAAAAVGVPCWPMARKDEFGAMIGRRPTAVAAVLDERLADALGKAIARLAALGGESPEDN